MELNAMSYLAVFIGGGIGSVLRFAMSKMIIAQGWLNGHWATLIVNVLASFALVFFVDAFSINRSCGIYFLELDSVGDGQPLVHFLLKLLT
jgi:fluoride ion exporter CrcB/FEX